MKTTETDLVTNPQQFFDRHVETNKRTSATCTCISFRVTVK